MDARDPADVALPASRSRSARLHGRPPSPTSSSFEHESTTDALEVAKKRVGMYPPIVLPPDFFDEEEEIEHDKSLFHMDKVFQNVLFDETNTVQVPFDEKCFLILDPSSRTRMLDAHVDHMTVLFGYERYVESAMKEQKALGHFDSVT